MVFVRKDYLKRTDFKKAIATVHAIPTASLDQIVGLLNRKNITYYKTTNNFKYVFIILVIFK